MKIEKKLLVNLNNEKEILQAINYNKENNYNYIISDSFSSIGTPLIPWGNICLLLRNDYKIEYYNEKQPTFKHKNYNDEIIEEGKR